jgi:cell fate regulator YaaT (PSP1 superfamily)
MDSSESNTPEISEENINQSNLEATNNPEEMDEVDTRDSIDSSQFTEGQELQFIRVRFPGSVKSFGFLLASEDPFSYGQKVIAMSDRGMAVGFVNSFPYTIHFTKDLLPIRRIARFATDADQMLEESIFKEEQRLKSVAERLIEKNQLDMQLTQVEISQMGKKAIFNFTAPTRVDFRGLVHEMVGELKMRIELRQVSVRDRASAVGGLGPCGRELCCSSFLAKYGNVGIKLAKNQDLSLNSSKINGVCGQLKCCLTYEDEVYQEKRKKLPRDNALVKLKDGNMGKVTRLHVLLEQFEVINPEGIIRRYVSDMWDGLAEGLQMPKFFEHGVTDNTTTIIGLDKVNSEKSLQHEKDLLEAKEKAKTFADDIFVKLFGEKTLDWSLPEVEEPINPFARKLPDEEEEVIYITPEDELLDDDDDDDESDDIAQEPQRPTPRHEPRHETRPTGRTDDRPRNHHPNNRNRNRNRGPRGPKPPQGR